jgi:hypothetical protein
VNRGKDRGKRAAMENKTMMVTLVQRGGKARSRAMAKVDGTNLAEAVRDTVDPAAILMTDTNPAYNKVGQEFAGHFTVNHHQDEYVCAARVHQPRMSIQRNRSSRS